ncbi:MAG: methyltransferase domain-containing protein [Verrucomicrobia bacterium]|nr:methyltransferase domain-containing protein [Verrucomicrobiota bacterium]
MTPDESAGVRRPLMGDTSQPASRKVSITSSIPVTSLLRGHIDRFVSSDDSTVIEGWVVHEQFGIERIDIKLGGLTWVSQATLFRRPDVRKTYEPLLAGPRPHLEQAGFKINAPAPQPRPDPATTLVEIVPHLANGRPIESLLTHFCAPDQQFDCLPPPALQERVGGAKDFVQIGSQLATLIMTCAAKHKADFLDGNILDWGCGCGRVVAQLSRFIPRARLHGCDIDRATIEWDSENIAGATFTAIPAYPPTEYPDAFFDLIYGISVMTHLSEEAQFAWLEELRRISRPGAIILLSVIGEKLRKTNMPPELENQFRRDGFASFVPGYSGSFTEFSHAGYYRETYHRLDYIERTWGNYFELLEYVETKHQDVVVLRKA